MFDLAQYTLELVRRDAELVLFRGLRKVREEGSRHSILVRAPVADPPAPAIVRSLQEEYALRSELDPDYVVRPLSMVQDQGRPMLILEDPPGTPLDLLLNGAMDIAQFLRLAIRVAAALGHVHGRDLVHKDIKPANVLVNAALTHAWLMGLGVASHLPREQFEALTRTSTFSPGSGLPGRVLASGAPAHIPDVTRDPNFPRADIAAREGLRGAFAFPILLGCEVLGVIEFFSREVWQRDDDLLVMMATIGSQIGQFTKRAAAVDELQLRVNMLQQIPVAAWSVMPDGTPDIVNQLWYEYTGQTPEFVNSHPEAWMATVHPEDRESASRTYWDRIRSGRGFTMEGRFLRARDRTYRWHLNRAVPVRDPAGNILRFVATSTDVHELRHAQEALRNTQAECYLSAAANAPHGTVFLFSLPVNEPAA